MGYLDFDEYDERENKNLFCTPDEINERQIIELVGLLDRWEADTIKPWDVLLELSYITGVKATGIISYHNRRKYHDGTENSNREIEGAIADIKHNLRPEILARDPQNDVIASNIREIRRRIEMVEFDSWDAAIAIAEVLFSDTKRESDHHPVTLFKKDIAWEKKHCGFGKRSKSTLEMINPETEDDIKQPLAHLFAKWRKQKAFEDAYQTWQKEREAKGEKTERYIFEFERMRLNPDIDDGFDEDDEADAETAEDETDKDQPEEERIEFIPPIDYPDWKLCNEILIAPSGTGLIKVYEPSPYDESHDEMIYGTTVARITTYTVSFIPKNLTDLPLLKEIIEKAIRVLARTPYKYSLPEHWMPSGDKYDRVGSGRYYYHREDDYVPGCYVEVKDGKVTPDSKFDLDDLWVLYYLVEPIIEPTTQIAAAMNAARYAEERGAILEPAPVDYIDHGHEVVDKVGYLKDKDPEQLLAIALRDSLIARTLNENRRCRAFDACCDNRQSHIDRPDG